MRVLVTGNMGYVGSTVSKFLREAHPDAVLHGYDAGYFAHCLTGAARLPETALDAQFFGDVRDLPAEMLAGYDAVVQLAAISNDPMGHRFERITEEINQTSSISLAKAAAAAGVGHFVFASSCSVYGIAEGGPRKEDDPLNPITAYARSKIGTERALAGLNGDMTVSCLRFATACGMSDRLRLDLVLNDFVASALATGRITVLSDGTPWRPLIDTEDMARAIDWAISRDPSAGGRYLAVNVGSEDRNYQVRQLAEAVAGALPGTDVSINTDAPADSRSYQVDFSLYRSLAPDHQPQVTLAQSIAALKDGLTGMQFHDADFRNSQMIRLKVLEAHMAAGRLDDTLVWQGAARRDGGGEAQPRMAMQA
ncbi:NAD-dependent epimerase/dehydratase family protein [Paenirhodobacter populi]|uniref:SDR family oxidoreductase n=1 Tax=Paenirhodobacter populi TaxID=2306993 RepID=A0A443JNR7_9RHOB|nr:SDR family oxidoreductase [Sinirhodobacter populi]RWR22146.1 SDR family oxidoreductase [Sinirhodobacter populi]